LILVDTKYEFGVDDDNNIVIVDELHTPDSSRYWLQQNYHERLQHHEEPESFDKEILRLWMKANADPYKDKILPQIPLDVIQKVSARYTELYSKITGKQFIFNHDSASLLAEINNSIQPFLGD
jgi:phosphoribosylaminoimidazole-succinocarboxamide synthase